MSENHAAPDQTSGNDQQINDQTPADQKTNDSNNEDSLLKLWDKPEEKPDDTSGQNFQQPAPGDQVSPTDALNAHIEKLDLTNGVDTNALFEASKSDDPKAFGEAMQNSLSAIAANTYTNALRDAHKMLDARVAKATEEAVNKATGEFKVTNAVNAMEAALPFTKDPAIGPVAKGVMGQLMSKDPDIDKAIEGVTAFFQRTRKLTDKDLGRPPQSRPGTSQFNNPPQDEEETDWIAELTQ